MVKVRKSCNYIGSRNNCHLAFTGEHTVCIYVSSNAFNWKYVVFEPDFVLAVGALQIFPNRARSSANRANVESPNPARVCEILLCVEVVIEHIHAERPRGQTGSNQPQMSVRVVWIKVVLNTVVFLVNGSHKTHSEWIRHDCVHAQGIGVIFGYPSVDTGHVDSGAAARVGRSFALVVASEKYIHLGLLLSRFLQIPASFSTLNL